MKVLTVNYFIIEGLGTKINCKLLFLNLLTKALLQY